MIPADATNRLPMGSAGTSGRRRLIAALITVGLLALATPALAQLRRIEGKVTDEQGRPVAGAAIEVTSVAVSTPDDGFRVRNNESGQKWQTKTNENGEYIIGVPSSGLYLLTASKEAIGIDRTRVAVGFGNAATANVTLWKPAAARMPEEDCARSAAPKAFERSVLAAAGDSGLTRLTRWLEAVQLHTPGCGDPPATEVGSWSRGELETLLRDIRELVRFLHRVQRAQRAPTSQQRDQLIFFIYNRRFTLDELERIFYGNERLTPNEMLRRGAVLHADIAMFVPGNLSGEPLVMDGGRKGWRPGTLQWEIGRQLLDSVTPSPSADAGALLWYRAVSAYLLREGHLAEVSAHLNRARQVFPERSVFLIDSAYLHQDLSSPAIQAAVQATRADGINVAVGSRRAELQQAERFFRQALALAPHDADARLRLGQTLGELGRHEEAAAELRGAIDARPDEQRLYLAELFLGREEQALGRREEAKRRFENAAALYPNAQSPRLALSQLARQSGDRAGALRALQSATAHLPSDVDRTDPWWDYYLPHLDDAGALMDQMRTLGSLDTR